MHAQTFNRTICVDRTEIVIDEHLAKSSRIASRPVASETGQAVSPQSGNPGTSIPLFKPDDRINASCKHFMGVMLWTGVEYQAFSKAPLCEAHAPSCKPSVPQCSNRSPDRHSNEYSHSSLFSPSFLPHASAQPGPAWSAEPDRACRACAATCCAKAICIDQRATNQARKDASSVHQMPFEEL